MSINELARIKRWQVAHKAQHPLEYHTWDAMLTLWLMGWVGILPALIFSEWILLACALGIGAPGLYVHYRVQAHQRHTLRCDWGEQHS
jgi:hypothetical protein